MASLFFIMKAEIIAIGDEILIGQVKDTNSSFIATHLNDLGIEVLKIKAIADTREDLVESLDTALETSDFVFITGGLGPTKDDRTKYTLSEYFGSKLVENKEVFSHIESLIKGRGESIRMNKLNKSQALVPEKCTLLKNRKGTAPGMLFEKDGKMVFSMPGVPYEMKSIFTKEIRPILECHNGKTKICNKTIYVYNIVESMLAEKLEDWENALPDYCSLAYLPSPGYMRLRLTAKGEDLDFLCAEIDKQLELLSSYISYTIADMNNDTIEKRVSTLAREKGFSLGTAESCTGGNIAHLITSLAGSSDIFKGGIVSYANEIKMNVLGVKSSDLDAYGAVSQPVVEQMARGAREVLSTDFAVATSGIAGPGGGSDDKPVGTVWIAVASRDGVVSRKFLFSKIRELNISKASSRALEMLLLEMGR